MRKLILLLVLLIAGLVVALGVAYWPRITHKFPALASKGDSKADLEKAQALIKEGNPKEAIKIIKKYRESIESHTPEGNQWLALLLDASEAIPEPAQLTFIYEYNPALFDNKEKAVLFVADQYIRTGQKEKYATLRQKWKGREKRNDMWFVLDADKLLLEGNRIEAIDFLKSKTFEGKADSGRLVRLGLLNVLADPQTAWKYFSEAVEKDPENPDLRIYRAKLLEAAGKPAIALQEYATALRLDPNNLSLRDLTAEFYLRNKQFPLAMEMWAESLPAPSSDIIWLKAIFWNKVLMPLKFDWAKHTPPEGALEPLISYLLALKPNQFWDNARFEKVPDGQKFLSTQQSTFWLRLLSALQQGKEKEAAQLLEYNTFQQESWNPELELALMRVLHYRQKGTLQLGGLETSMKELVAKKQSPMRPVPQFYKELEELTQISPKDSNKKPPIPGDIDALLKSNDIFAALFLAANWLEAGILLNTSNIIPDSYPEWYAYSLAQALRFNRGNMEAMEFLTKQQPTQPIEMLMAEVLIAEKNPDAALEQLDKLVSLRNEYGIRAAWLQSLIYIDKQNYAKAEEIVYSQPLLRESTLGKETLARIALLTGNDEKALMIYKSIEKDSPEARSYLARKAFEEKDWKRARTLTEQLLIDYPNNLTLRDNLIRIEQEEQKLNLNRSPASKSK